MIFGWRKKFKKYLKLMERREEEYNTIALMNEQPEEAHERKWVVGEHAWGRK